MSSVAIYGRWASADKATLERQLAPSLEYARQRFGATTPAVFADPVVSGQVMESTKLDELVAFCTANGGTTVIVSAADRLGRSIEALSRTLERLTAAGATVVTADGIELDQELVDDLLNGTAMSRFTTNGPR